MVEVPKGLAHIGILKAIDSAGLSIDYITGTSMGSIIGSLYAVRLFCRFHFVYRTPYALGSAVIQPEFSEKYHHGRKR